LLLPLLLELLELLLLLRIAGRGLRRWVAAAIGEEVRD
jgi:hypothetical protein